MFGMMLCINKVSKIKIIFKNEIFKSSTMCSYFLGQSKSSSASSVFSRDNWRCYRWKPRKVVSNWSNIFDPHWETVVYPSIPLAKIVWTTMKDSELFLHSIEDSVCNIPGAIAQRTFCLPLVSTMPQDLDRGLSWTKTKYLRWAQRHWDQQWCLPNGCLPAVGLTIYSSKSQLQFQDSW